MSAISHLVWHDIRALRLPLIAWLILLLAQAAVMAVGPAILDPESPRGVIQSLAGFLAGARLAFTILLTVLFIQRDSPVGTTAFWMTRPIQPSAMAASKLISALLLLVALPAVVGWSLFTALGLPHGDVLDGVWQFAVEQIMVVGLSTMGAAITATLPQFAVVAVAAVMFMGTLIGQARPFIQQLPPLPLAGSSTPLANWAVVTVVGAAGGARVPGPPGGTLSARRWPRRVCWSSARSRAFTVRPPFDAAPPAPIRESVLNPAAVGLDVHPVAVRVESGSTNDARGRQTRYRYAGAVLRTSGAPPAIVLQPWSIASTWHPGDSPAIQWQRRSARRLLAQRARAKRMTTDNLLRASREPWEASSC